MGEVGDIFSLGSSAGVRWPKALVRLQPRSPAISSLLCVPSRSRQLGVCGWSVISSLRQHNPNPHGFISVYFVNLWSCIRNNIGSVN